LETVDVIAAPTCPIPPEPIGPIVAATANANRLGIRNTYPANHAGVPAISIPAGLTPDGLPIGFQLMAGAFEDRKLLAIAEFVEGLVGFDCTPPILAAAAA